MKKDFTLYGVDFHLNNNRVGISKANYEFFPRYGLMYFDGERWTRLSAVNTKKEAVAYIRSLHKSGLI